MNEDNKNWRNKIEQLKSHPSDINLEMEWEALERRMDKKKRRRLAIWWWPILFGLTISGGYFYTISKAANAKNSSDQLKDVLALQQVVTVFDNDTKGNDINQLHKEEVGPTSLENNVLQSNTLNANSSIRSNNKVSLEIQYTEEPIVSDLSNRHDLNGEILVQPIEDLQSEETTKLVATRLKNIENTSDIVRQDQSLAKLGNMQLNAINLLHPEIIDMNISTHQKLTKPFFIDVRTMIGQPVYTYQSNHFNAESVVAKRKKFEHPLEAFGTRLSIGKEIGYQFYTTVGMTYSRLNDRWQSVVYDTISSVLENQVIETYTNQAGVVTQKTGTQNVRQRVEISQTRYNSIQSFSSMLSIGRYFYINKWRWAIEANIALPVFLSYKGESLNEQGQMLNLQDIYRSNRNIQYGMNTSYIYPVSGNLAIYGGYDYIYSQLNTNLGFIRKQHIHSISIGMKYFIKK